MATGATTSLSCCYFNLGSSHQPLSPTTPPSSLYTSTSSSPSSKPKSLHLFPSKLFFTSSPNKCFPCFSTPSKKTPSLSPVVLASVKPEPLKIMISGAPASGKGTQCELITKKYGLVHVAAGDLLRAEISSGSENGRQAKEFMEKGQLVPNEIVVTMVKDRLLQPDSQENGWLLDGYPRSSSQATALQKYGFRPDLFILLDVDEEILVERVVGRRLDPVTGKIYHLKYSPPETEEIAARLTQRFDDTEEKVKLRLRTHHQNVKAVLSMFEDVTLKVNGNVAKEEVFAQIDSALMKLLDDRKSTSVFLTA